MTGTEQARAVLWDLDDTLVDSGELHWWSWRDGLGAAGVPVTYEQFLDSFGQKNDRILRRWLGPEATVARIEHLADAKESEFRRLAAAHGLQPLPGAAEWVQRLHESGWTQAASCHPMRSSACWPGRRLDTCSRATISLMC